MDIIERAYRELFPDREFRYAVKVRFSAAFNDYNANIRFHQRKNLIVVSLSKRWKEAPNDIRLGLVQELLLKMFGNGDKRRTLEMDLYHLYMKNTHLIAEKNKIDEKLLESFKRVNSKYFDSEIEQTNLVWGRDSMRTLGRYEYGSDTIIISSIFKDAPDVFIDKVMHHEMLHKKHKFDVKNGRCTHHTSLFRREERNFENFENVEKEISDFIKRKKGLSGTGRKKKSLLGWLNGF
ncbi:MAG: SprT-like domain-containing protein [Candidatus Woesearchaeota archaeon]